jgi:hypothetical protein
MLYVLQPIVRGWHRQTHLLRHSRLPRINGEASMIARKQARRISACEWDLYFSSDEARGRQELLRELVDEAARCGWRGDFDDAWSNYDVKLVGDRWHDIRVRTATEELGWPNRFTRVRCLVRPTQFCRAFCTVAFVWSLAALATLQPWALMIAVVAQMALLVSRIRSRRRCFSAITTLIARAGVQARLQPTSPSGQKLDQSFDVNSSGRDEPYVAAVLLRQQDAESRHASAQRVVGESSMKKAAVAAPRR